MTVAGMWSDFLDVRPILRHSNGVFVPRGVVLHVNADESGTPWEFYNAEPPTNPSTVTPTGQFQQDGTGFQTLPYNYSPWCQADGNQWGLAFECQGEPNEPMSDAMIHSLGQAFFEAWIANNKSFPLAVCTDLSQGGLATHAMGGAGWGGHTSCPGDIRTAQRQSIVDVAISYRDNGGSIMTAPQVADIVERLGRIEQATTNIQEQNHRIGLGEVQIAPTIETWIQKYIPAELGGTIQRVTQILALDTTESADVAAIKAKLASAGTPGSPIDVHALAVELSHLLGTSLSTVK